VTVNHTISVTFKPGCLPNAVVQVWDDVLSVVNNPLNNGGYTFTAYQWIKYLNGNATEITGATSGNLYLASDPDKATAEYVCRVTTANNLTIESCPFRLNLGALKVYPNPTTGLVIVEGETLKQGDRIDVFSATGTLVKQYTANPRQTTIELGNQPQGVYVVKVNGKEVKVILL